jgi:hypothetical protein
VNLLDLLFRSQALGVADQLIDRVLTSSTVRREQKTFRQK